MGHSERAHLHSADHAGAFLSSIWLLVYGQRADALTVCQAFDYSGMAGGGLVDAPLISKALYPSGSHFMGFPPFAACRGLSGEYTLRPQLRRSS